MLSNFRKPVPLHFLFGAICSLTLAACGGGDDDAVAAPPAGVPPVEVVNTTITGTVVKGPVAAASVCGYAVAANARGASLGSCVMTNASGRYTLTVPASSGAVWVEATGGAYTDEVTNTATNLPAGSALRSIVTASGGTVTSMLTPLTSLALNAAAATAGAGGTLNNAAFSAAELALRSSFNLPADLDIRTTAPLFGSGINSYGNALTAISRMVANGLTLQALLATVNAQTLSAAYAAAAAPTSPTAPTPGATTFMATGSLLASRDSHAATLLPSGKVLVSGGFDSSSLAVAAAELYDPATAAWTAASAMVIARSSPTATLLANGKVLVSGGQTSLVRPTSLASAELYDPATNRWSAAGSLATARSVHTATLLPSGKVLVAGGLNTAASANSIAIAELYDPATNTWTPAGAMATARYAHTATLLPTGKVLVIAGLAASGEVATAELYDPATNSWTTVGRLTTARSLHTATLLANGKLLVAGGSGFATGSFVIYKSAEIYDPAANVAAAAAPMAVARGSHTMTLLRNDKVLVSGGFASLASGEIYDAGTDTWTATGAMGAGRHAHTATLLNNGRVLIGGGVGSKPDSAELF